MNFCAVQGSIANHALSVPQGTLVEASDPEVACHVCDEQSKPLVYTHTSQRPALCDDKL
jgi:hypothetical protein